MSMRTDDVYAILSKRIDMQGATPSQIQEAVNKYLSENPVDSVTEENIKEALGYVPADEEDVNELNEKIVQQGKQCDEVRNAFEITTSNNVLNPDNAESGFYESTLEPTSNPYRMRSVEPISIPENKLNIYVATNFASDFDVKDYMISFLFIDSNGNFVSQSSSRFANFSNGLWNVSIPQKAVKFHIWTSGAHDGVTFDNVCLSFSPISSYEAYSGNGESLVRLKEKYATVPNKVLADIEKISSNISTVLSTYEIIKSNNIVNPNNFEKGYFDTNLNKLDNDYRLRTIEPIAVDKGSTLYITAKFPDGIDPRINEHNWLFFFLDDNSNLISYTTYRFSQINGIVSSQKIPDNCSKFHAYMSGLLYGATVENICISEVEITEYEKYTDEQTLGNLKNEYAPTESQKLFKGKTIVNFGDSIFGKRRPPEDISTKLAELTGATVYNCGFSGCRMSKHSLPNYDPFSMYRLTDSIISGDWTLQEDGIANAAQSEAVPSYFSETLEILKQLDFNKVDIITIAYGTNDFTSGVDMESDDTHATTTFAGALRYSIENLLTAYPNLKIFICSQTYRFWMDSDNVFTEDSDTHTNGDGVKLTDFITKTEAVAKEYHLPYINNYDIGMNKFNRSRYFPVADGTHPIITGCHLIAENMANKLY